MAIQVNGTEVISNSRALNNIASVDATTAAAIGAAGVGGASGEKEFTAGEALTAGDVLGLRSDGKVVKRSLIVGPESQDYSNDRDEGVYYSAWDEDNQFFIYGIGYGGPSGTPRIQYIVGQVNADRSISSVGTFYAGAQQFGSRHIGMAYDTNANKVVMYLFDNDNGQNRPKVVVGTVNSNKTISFGSLTTMPDFPESSYFSRGMCFDPSTNKCVFIGSSGAYTYDVRACVGTVSGNSISFGSATAVSSSANNAGNERVAIHVPGASKNVCLWMENRSNKQNIVARSTTISGTSLTFGSEGSVTPSGNFTQDGLAAVADPTSGSSKFLAACYDTTTDEICGYVGTLSGTSVSFGPKVVLGRPSDFTFTAETSVVIKEGSTSLSQIPNSNRVVLGFHVWSNLKRRVFTKALTISGTSIVVGPASEMKQEQANNSYLQQGKAFLLPDYKEGANVMVTGADNTSTFVNTVDSQAIQGDPAKFVGIAAESISNGSAGQVTVVGGINTNLSGLTQGSVYGMKTSSGDLSIFPDDSEDRVGRAISSTSLYIDKAFGENN